MSFLFKDLKYFLLFIYQLTVLKSPSSKFVFLFHFSSFMILLLFNAYLVSWPGLSLINSINDLVCNFFFLKVLKIIEKPKKFISDYAITGLYFFDRNVSKYSMNLKPSKRGELEIVDLINIYKKKNKLGADFIGRGGAWLDTGSIDDFYKTSAFVQAIENRQGLKIACLEEIAFNKNWIDQKKIFKQINFYGKCEYSNYLRKLIVKKN